MQTWICFVVAVGSLGILMAVGMIGFNRRAMGEFGCPAARWDRRHALRLGARPVPRFVTLRGMDAELWGLLDPSILQKIVVVSPHFDDAALGAAHLLDTYPGSTVITVLAGRPPAYPDQVTEWDAAVWIRRRRRRGRGPASGGPGGPGARSGPSHVWLDFSDQQYLDPSDRPDARRCRPGPGEAVATLAPSAVFLPMGLAHPDHVLTHAAGLLVRDALAGPAAVPAPSGSPGRARRGRPGSVTRTGATSTCPACWPDGSPACSTAACGPRPPWYP